MPHINTEPGQHDSTVSAYIVRMDADQPRLLMHKHKKAGIWLQFGGHVELDETPWQAVLHEIEEEAGYLPEQLKLLQPKTRIKSLPNLDLHPVPFLLNTHEIDDGTIKQHFHSDLSFGFIVSGEPGIEIREGESNEIFEFSYDDLRNIYQGEISEDAIIIGEFVLTKLLSEWEQVDF